MELRAFTMAGRSEGGAKRERLGRAGDYPEHLEPQVQHEEACGSPR